MIDWRSGSALINIQLNHFNLGMICLIHCGFCSSLSVMLMNCKQLLCPVACSRVLYWVLFYKNVFYIIIYLANLNVSPIIVMIIFNCM